MQVEAKRYSRKRPKNDFYNVYKNYKDYRKMFKIRVSYLLSGIATGCILLISFFWTLPDGKLHIVFCNVGQGDAAYVRFPDGRDMLVDGGPDDSVLGCLGRHMPFWDRRINIVVLSHPQKDHLQGLTSVLERFTVDYFVRSDIDNDTEGFVKLLETIRRKTIPIKLETTGDRIMVGTTTLSFLWPSASQIAKKTGEPNDNCLVFFLRYGTFDAVFPGDADSHVERYYTGGPLADSDIELLKVPHHGSKTGMTDDFIQWLHPKLAVISVGKNSYGHPSSEAFGLLSSVGAKVLRTDRNGDIEIVSDGNHWVVTPQKKGVH